MKALNHLIHIFESQHTDDNRNMQLQGRQECPFEKKGIQIQQPDPLLLVE